MHQTVGSPATAKNVLAIGSAFVTGLMGGTGSGTVCSDLPGNMSGTTWFDGTNGCLEYKENSGWCDLYGSTDYNGEGTADDKCCTCGGGSNNAISFEVVQLDGPPASQLSAENPCQSDLMVPLLQIFHDDSCYWAKDGVCDSPPDCLEGTDTTDCDGSPPVACSLSVTQGTDMTGRVGVVE